MSRVVSWFSCGAASAVATKLAIAQNLSPEPITIVYCELVEEHPDNLRFLADCEKWFGQPIIRLIGRHGGSAYRVFEETGYLKGPNGAACTRVLKKEVRQLFQRPDDTHVFGYTSEEVSRFDSFLDANNLKAIVPLIDAGLTKSDVLALVERAGIRLPAMYLLGYGHNNCIGCVKGEAGYWNKIRVDFPETFERMALLEEKLHRTVCKVEKRVNGVRELVRVSLRQLKPDQGKYVVSEMPQCGIFCELAEGSLS